VITAPVIRWSAIAPELVLLGGAMLLLIVAVVLHGRAARNAALAIGVGCFVGAAVATGVIWDYGGGSWTVLAGQLRVDRFGDGIRIVVAVAGVLTLLASLGWHRLEERGPEFVSLLLVAAAGMDLLALSASFVTLFVALELFSVTLYALCAFEVGSAASLESGFKYLVLGSVGSAVLVYGAAFIYGATGSFQFDAIARSLAAGGRQDLLVLAGMAFVLAGLGFKIAAVPFHMWTPDVYEGAPTPVAGFMAAATKAAAFAVLFRVLVDALPAEAHYWRPAVAVLAIVSMVVGNVAALTQRNVKRMLAYSSIGHAGYLLMAVIATSQLGARALVFYLGVYTAMTVGAFAVVAARERETGEPVTLASLRGWGFQRPFVGGAMAICLLSLAGFPPTGGFLAKVYVFGAAIRAGYTYLAIVGAITTVISLGYYLKVGLAIFDRTGAVPVRRTAPGYVTAAAAALIAAAGTVALGIYPPNLLDWAQQAATTVVAAGR
jgi:NADH-quinone oxidoreductase subunit N